MTSRIYAGMLCLTLCLLGVAQAGQLSVETISGPVGAVGSNDAPSSAARLKGARGVAFDLNQNILFADTGNNTIRRVDAMSNLVSTLAGSGLAGSQDGMGSAAQFNQPDGLVVDSIGNVFVADSGNHTIRKIDPTGLVTTFAGRAATSGNADGTGVSATFTQPRGLAIDASDTLFVADAGSSVIRQITSAGVVTTLAGVPNMTGSTDGPAGTATFNQPAGVTVDPAGVVYVADTQNHTIRSITPAGIVSTLAGQAGMPGYPPGGGGTGTGTQFNFPTGIALGNTFMGPPTTLYVTDTLNHVIRTVDTVTGDTSLYVGNPNENTPPQPGSQDGNGAFNAPTGIVFTNPMYPVLLIADTGNNLIRVASFGEGIYTQTVAGVAGPQGYYNANSIPPDNRYNLPTGLCIDGSGNLIIAEPVNQVLRQVFPMQNTTTLAGQFNTPGAATGDSSTGQLNGPNGVSAVGTTIFIADTQNDAIRTYDPTNGILDYVGLIGMPGYNDNVGASAQFNAPKGILAVDATTQYVADSGNHTIRQIVGGSVMFFAGGKGVAGAANGNVASAQFNNPTALAMDAAGNLYVADTDNHTIRKIDTLQNVTTLAGSALNPGSANGTGAAARFNHPSGLVVVGNTLYVADTDNNTIRAIDLTTRAVTTVAGLATVAGGADGMGSAARFDGPVGIACADGINIYIVDSRNSNIRHATVSISDTATIDMAQAPITNTRQLGVATPSAAPTYFWTLIREPSGSMAQLSDPTAANPTFTPDVPDLYVFQLIARSGGGLSISTVSLLAMPPSFTPVITSALSATATVGQFFTYTITATNNPTLFDAMNLPAGLSVDPMSGIISGTPTVSGLFAVNLLAGNTSGPGTAVLDLTVNATAPVITSATTATATVGQPFTYTITAINTPTLFDATNLPAGLSVDPMSGIISGTPTASGMATVTLAASNSAGTGTAVLVLTVNPIPPVITSALSDTAKQGAPYLYTLTAINTPTTVSATNLPPGLIFSPATSLISGTPTLSGTFNIVLMAGNSAGTDTKTLVLKVLSPVGPMITLFTTNDNPGFVGGQVSYTFSAIDAGVTTLNYTFSFGDGAPLTGTFAQGTNVTLSHIYMQPGDYNVSLSITDGGTLVTQSALESIPAPASGATGVPNVSNQTDTVTDPLTGLTIGVMSSNGGVIQLGINVASLTRAQYDVSTDWGDISGRSTRTQGVRPVHQYVHHGIFVAKVTAINKTTGQIAGTGRKTLTISTKETGEPDPDAANPGTGKTHAAIGDAPNADIITKSLTGKFNFGGGSAKDTVTFSGLIALPSGLDIYAPHEFSIGIGNIIVDTTVSAGGRGTVPGGSTTLKTLSLKYPRIKKGALTVGGEMATVTATFSTAGMVAGGFDTEGVSGKAADAAYGRSAPRMIQVSMLMDGVPYEALSPVNFSISNNPDFGTISGRSRK